MHLASEITGQSATFLLIMPPVGETETGCQRHYVVMLSVCPSVCQSPNLWTQYFDNKWINFYTNWQSGPWAKGMKRSTLGVRRSKVKVIWGQR